MINSLIITAPGPTNLRETTLQASQDHPGPQAPLGMN